MIDYVLARESLQDALSALRQARTCLDSGDDTPDDILPVREAIFSAIQIATFALQAFPRPAR